jgi:hypothetical protein
LEVLEDPQGSLTIEDVASARCGGKFVPVRRAVPDFGMTKSAFWFRFVVDGRTRGAEEWLLLLDHSLMNRVDLYVPKAAGGFVVERSGDYRAHHRCGTFGRSSVPRNCAHRRKIRCGGFRLNYLLPQHLSSVPRRSLLAETFLSNVRRVRS